MNSRLRTIRRARTLLSAQTIVAPIYERRTFRAVANRPIGSKHARDECSGRQDPVATRVIATLTERFAAFPIAYSLRTAAASGTVLQHGPPSIARARSNPSCPPLEGAKNTDVSHPRGRVLSAQRAVRL